jgi:hypothetical protein
MRSPQRHVRNNPLFTLSPQNRYQTRRDTPMCFGWRKTSEFFLRAMTPSWSAHSTLYLFSYEKRPCALQDGVIWWCIFTSALVKFRTKYRLSDTSGPVSILCYHRVETYRDITDRRKHCGRLRYHVPTFFQATGRKMINCACSASLKWVVIRLSSNQMHASSNLPSMRTKKVGTLVTSLYVSTLWWGSPSQGEIYDVVIEMVY